MIRLSLIIPTHNRAGQLLAALESVVRQDMPAGEWECVVVNNNSTDDTPARFAAFAARYPALNLRMVTETGPGVSYARNRGIAETSAPYMAFIDDDERIAPTFISAYITLFDTVPEAVAGGGPIVPVYPSGRPAWMSRFTERPIANTMYLGDRIREFPEGHIPGGGNMAIRRSAVKRYGVFDVSLGRVGTSLTGGEESDLFERLRLAEAKYFYTPRAVMYHIIPEEKLTEEYFSRLSYNIGVSQLRRAVFYRRVLQTRAAECVKWAATAVIAAWFFVTLRWSKARYLILMRCGITRGLWSEARRGAQTV